MGFYIESRGDLIAVAGVVIAVVLFSFVTGYIMHQQQAYLPLRQIEEFHAVNLSEDPSALGHIMDVDRLVSIYRSFHKPMANGIHGVGHIRGQ